MFNINGDEDRVRAIETREPCQMGNQAAISGAFDVLRSARSEPFLEHYAFGRVLVYGD